MWETREAVLGYHRMNSRLDLVTTVGRKYNDDNTKENEFKPSRNIYMNTKKITAQHLKEKDDCPEVLSDA